jgi:hypothetical protein|mmetsp:Transcript_3050/g.12666  ORF Transcript_3050/g.12666 Transcript_3050/m.12666 type:complete len:84 (+) Transcript_3050:4832-5083(+)
MPSLAALAGSSTPASKAPPPCMLSFSVMLEMLLWLPRLPLRRLEAMLSTEERRLPTMDWSRSSSNGDLGGDTSFGGDCLVGDP